VLDSLVQMVSTMLGVDNCSLMLFDPGAEEMRIRAACGMNPEIARKVRVRPGEGIAGWVAQHGTPLLITDVENHPLFQRKSSSKYSTKSLLSVPLKHRERVLGVLNVNNKQDGGIFTKSDELLLSVVANFALITLDKARMREVMVQKERLDAELDVARQIQRQMLPQVLLAVKGYELAARCRSALEVAGDFYDLFSLADGRLCFVLGDVCGKGIPASLYMARVLSYFRSIASMTGSAESLMTRANALVSHEWSERTFVTACLVVLDSRGNQAHVYSAGHHAPLVVRGDRIEAMVTEDGLPLGIDAKATFPERRVELNPGDCLALYTDGITEAKSPTDENFGEERLRQVLLASDGGASAEAVLGRVFAAVEAFAEGRDQSDDQTMLVIRRL
jgi:sigma-B regulation protein RsbU (phosphoserine phosphatase)